MPSIIATAKGSRTDEAMDRAGWWPLAVIATAHLMVILDTTVMFVALPSITRDLGMDAASRSWVVTAYTLALAAMLLPGGRVADRVGARRTLMVGVAGFAMASAVGGASSAGSILIGARAVQGAFGALVVSSTKSLLVTVYRDPAERARVIGAFTATLTAGFALGLVIGGLVTCTVGWRGCLYLNVGLALLALVGAPRVLPAPATRPGVRVDAASALLAAGGMAALIYGLGAAASAGWWSPTVVGTLVASVVLLGVFLARQAGLATPLLPLGVVADRVRGPALLALIVNALSTFGMLLVLTYQLQSVVGYSALATGLALIPFAACAVLGSALLAPWLILRVSPGVILSGGVLAEAAGLLPLVALVPSSGYVPLILAATLVEGLGTGIAGPAALALALGGVGPADSGAAGAVTSAASQLGGSMGAALLNTIAIGATADYLTRHLGATTVAATVHGFTVAMAWGTAILLVALVPIGLLVGGLRPRVVGE
jgi:MFS family permease